MHNGGVDEAGWWGVGVKYSLRVFVLGVASGLISTTEMHGLLSVHGYILFYKK